jgi:hypothetical protein
METKEGEFLQGASTQPSEAAHESGKMDMERHPVNAKFNLVIGHFLSFFSLARSPHSELGCLPLQAWFTASQPGGGEQSKRERETQPEFRYSVCGLKNLWGPHLDNRGQTAAIPGPTKSLPTEESNI